MRTFDRCIAILSASMALAGCEVPLQDAYVLRSEVSVPRGVAYDREAQVLYVTALRGGEITMVTAVGREYPFHQDDEAISFGGAEIDDAARLLWVCAIDAREPALPRSWLRALDLEDGSVIHDVELGELMDGAPTRCEDVAIGADGAVFATDGLQSVIYRFEADAGASILIDDERLAPAAAGLRGLRGAAMDPSGEYLLTARADPAAIIAVPLVNPRALFEVEVGGDGLAAPADPRFPAADGVTFLDGDLHVVFSGGVRRIEFEGEGFVRGTSSTATGLPRGLSMATAADGALYVVDGDAFQVEILGVSPAPPFQVVRVEPSSFK